MSSLTTRRIVNRELQAGVLTENLLNLYEQAARGEIVDKQGRRWGTLTDYEAAALLGCERSSVCSCRNRLVSLGAVREHYQRYCRWRPSRNRVSAWGLVTTNALSEQREAGASDVHAAYPNPQPTLFPTH